MSLSLMEMRFRYRLCLCHQREEVRLAGLRSIRSFSSLSCVPLAFARFHSGIQSSSVDLCLMVVASGQSGPPALDLDFALLGQGLRATVAIDLAQLVISSSQEAKLPCCARKRSLLRLGQLASLEVRVAGIASELSGRAARGQALWGF